MLAWIRTGIALITLGFVIARLGVWMRLIAPGAEADPQRFGTAWIGAVFVALGALANGAAVVRFLRARRSIVARQEIPISAFPALFGIVVTAFGALLGGYLLLRIL